MRLRALAISNDSDRRRSSDCSTRSRRLRCRRGAGGLFAAAGGYSGVLLSPLTILVAGIGTGGRAFDGRLRQPGLGTKRPRGFLPDEPVPVAARVAVPGGIAAAAVANAYDGAKSLGSLVKHGILRAERAGADARAEVLGRVRSAGQVALSEQSFMRPFLRLAGPSEGGLITQSDFANVSDVESRGQHSPRCRFRLSGSALVRSGVARAVAARARHWRGGVRGRRTRGVRCRRLFSTRGRARARRFGAARALRRCAHPARRAPTNAGSPLPAPAPIAVRCNADGVPVEVCAEPGMRALNLSGPARLSISRDSHDA